MAVLSLALMLTAVNGAVRAQGVLEQMQTEIAGIAQRAKGAVVTIEDEPRRVQMDMEWNAGDAATREADKALQDQLRSLERLDAKEEGSREERARQRAAIQKQRAELRQTLAHVRESVREALRNAAPFVVAGGPKAGTGFCIGDGYVVTTADVLEGMRNPVVVNDTGTRVKASVVGIDPDLNVGLVRMPREADVIGLKWGDSSAVKVGHFAIAIGNQSGQANSVSLALVAGIRGAGTYAGARFYPGLIQIAGTVGAGASGAPLLNARGEVIGMVAAVPVGEWTERSLPFVNPTAPPVPVAPAPGKAGNKPGPSATAAPETWLFNSGRLADGRQGAGYALGAAAAGGLSRAAQAFTFVRPPVTSAGFAIPINDVRQAVDALRSGKPLERAWIGVSTRDDTRYETQGVIQKPVTVVLVEAVFPDSPAKLGGLQAGDAIVSLNGAPVDSSSDVRATALQLRPGQTLIVRVKRGGDLRTVSLRIAPRPNAIPRVPLPDAAPSAPREVPGGSKRPE